MASLARWQIQGLGGQDIHLGKGRIQAIGTFAKATLAIGGFCGQLESVF